MQGNPRKILYHVINYYDVNFLNLDQQRKTEYI